MPCRYQVIPKELAIRQNSNQATATANAQTTTTPKQSTQAPVAADKLIPK